MMPPRPAPTRKPTSGMPASNAGRSGLVRSRSRLAKPAAPRAVPRTNVSMASGRMTATTVRILINASRRDSSAHPSSASALADEDVAVEVIEHHVELVQLESGLPHQAQPFRSREQAVRVALVLNAHLAL